MEGIEIPGGVLAILAVVGLAVAAFAAAVWFGLSVIAPRLGRALDRADADDDEEPA